MTVHTRFKQSISFFLGLNDWCPCKKDALRKVTEVEKEELDGADCFGFYFVGEPLASKLNSDFESFIYKSEAKCILCNMFMPTKLTVCGNKNCIAGPCWAPTTVTTRWAPKEDAGLYLKYLDEHYKYLKEHKRFNG